MPPLVVQMVKSLPMMWEMGFDPWVRKIPWRRKWQPTPVFLPWSEEPGELQSTGLQSIRQDLVTNALTFRRPRYPKGHSCIQRTFSV